MRQQPWLSFAVFVLVQLALLLVAAFLRGLSARALVRVVIPSLLLGLPFGFLFDVLIGNGAAIFRYALPPSSLFLALNGAFSYGSAVATAALFPQVVSARWRSIRWLPPVLLFVVLIAAGGIGVGLRYGWILPRMISIGVWVVAAGEIAAALSGRAGPFYAMALGDVAPIASLCAASSAVGGIYEIANYCFPVWRWELGSVVPFWFAEGLIVMFGYVVLFHPLVVAWQLAQEKVRRPLSDKFMQRQ